MDSGHVAAWKNKTAGSMEETVDMAVHSINKTAGSMEETVDMAVHSINKTAGSMEETVDMNMSTHSMEETAVS